MPLPTNPYIAGNPVGTTQAFIGRDDVLREVLRVLRNPNQNAITLFGQRRIGKTSVLENLVERLPKEGNYHPVYFDLQDKASWTVQKVLIILARTIAESLDIDPFEGSIEDFKKKWLPKTLAQLPAKTSLILLFDEFDVLKEVDESQAADGFFPYLRELLSLDTEKLQFVFVLGRNLSDLNQLAISLFKGVPDKRVSLLSEKDTYKLVRLSEKNNTLKWDEYALKDLYTLTSGHPFFTQALASQIWENVYEDDPDTPPTIMPSMVKDAISSTLESSRNTLRWLWDGLGPAEKVIASALAQAGDNKVSDTELDVILRKSGVRILIRELQHAPKFLEDLDILKKVGNEYKFKVEFLRRWIAEHKPLSRVQKELDYIQPVAENIFQGAEGLYNGRDLESAKKLLYKSLSLNPNHIRANELLAEILISEDALDEAQNLLENLFELAPSVAYSRLSQIYLKQAENLINEDEKIKFLDKILSIDPHNIDATRKKRAIYKRMGLKRIAKFEKEKKFEKAIKVAQEMKSDFLDEKEWYKISQRLEEKKNIVDNYQQALGTLQEGDKTRAIRLLLKVLHSDANFEKATEYLHLAVSDEDISSLRTKNNTLNEDISKLKKSNIRMAHELALYQEKSTRRSKKKIRITNYSIIGITIILIFGILLFFINQKNRDIHKVTNTRYKDGAVMAYIPKGDFTMGYSTGNSNEKPEHEVTLDAFWIDQTEITNAMFAHFINENGVKDDEENTLFNSESSNVKIHNKDGEWQADQGYANHPATEISWYGAKAYCEWAEADLPTEAQWEKAARGKLTHNTYPWGNDLPVCKEKSTNGAQFISCNNQTAPIKSYSANGYGLYDMAGNVWEWTIDWYKQDYYENSPLNNPSGPKTGVYKIIRGGSWSDSEGNLRVALRYYSSPDLSSSDFGFRCARSSP